MEQLQIGRAKLTWLNGGVNFLDGGAMFGVVPKVLWTQRYPTEDNNLIELRTDPILLQIDGKNFLIDSGIGNGKLTEKQRRNFGVLEESFVEENLAELGLITMFVNALLCNWMVTMGAVMNFTSKATIGKIAAMWMPVFIFFAQGFEHAVVNMFVIPAAMMLDANIGLNDWWLWNQIPVTIGNFISGFLFTGLALHLIAKRKKDTLSHMSLKND